MTTLEKFTHCLNTITEILYPEPSERQDEDIFHIFGEPRKPEYVLDETFSDEHLATFVDRNKVLLDQRKEAITVEEKRQLGKEISDEVDKFISERKEKLEEYKNEMKKRSDELYARRMVDYEKRMEEWREKESMTMVLNTSKEKMSEYYDEYMANPTRMINRIITNYHYDWMPFTDSISVDLSFLKKFTTNEKVLQCLFEAVEIGRRNDGRKELLMKYDFTIEELLELTKLFTNPPFPLLNVQHGDEYENEASQQFDMISRENLRFVNDIAEHTLTMRRYPVPGRTITFRYNEDLTDKEEIEHFPPAMRIVYRTLFSDEDIVIEGYSHTVIEEFIRALYTGTISRNIYDDNAKELINLFVKYKLRSYAMLAVLVPCIRCNQNGDYKEVLEYVDKLLAKHENEEA